MITSPLLTTFLLTKVPLARVPLTAGLRDPPPLEAEMDEKLGDKPALPRI
jgi:hypothetical protein